MSPIPLNIPAIFNQQFKRGIIIYTDMIMHDETTAKKFLIPVNLNCRDETIYCVRCTTNVGRFNKEPYRSQGVFVDKSYAFFNKPTVIHCGEPIKYERAELVRRFCDGDLRLKDALPASVMKDVDKNLRISKLIAPNIKAVIVPQEAR